MRLHTETLNVQKSGVLVEQEFKIKATEKAFHILSSGLYSDKILAIVRELSCNAWDAHVAAGNTEVPFEIKLPTSLNPTFHVKDFGTGLSHEDVIELYTTYFDSSKNDSNDYIGALGLGSKSPFSYTPTFSIESRHNGTKRLYSAFIGERNIPAIALLGEEKTDEHNGLTVSLAVKSGDAEKFLKAAKRALMYFKPTPKVVGGGSDFRPYELKYTVHGSMWRLRETDYWAQMEDAHVVQGFVAYPIDRNILKQHGLSDLAWRILGLNIDLDVTIGDVEVAASREALSYTKKTIANLIKVTEVAAKEMRASIQKELDAQPTTWDAMMRYATYDTNGNKMRDIFNELHKVSPFTYKNKTIKEEIELDVSKIKHTKVTLFELDRFRRAPRARRASGWEPNINISAEWRLPIKTGLTVLIDDVHAAKNKVLVQYLEDQKQNQKFNHSTYVLVIQGVNRKSFKQSEVNSLIKQLEGATTKNVSALSYQQIKQKTTYTYRARKNDQCLVWQGFPERGGRRGRSYMRRVFSRLCWEQINIDPTDKQKEQFYVELERFSIVHSSSTTKEYFDIFLTQCKHLKILPTDVQIIGLNEKQAALAKRNKAWHNVFTYAADKFMDLNKTSLLTNHVINYNVLQKIGNGVARHIVVNWPSLCDQFVDGEFKQLLEEISALYESSKTCKHQVETVMGLGRTVDSTFPKDVEAQSNKLTVKFTNVLNRHSMLRLVDWDKVGAKDVDMIVDYVNFIATK